MKRFAFLLPFVFAVPAFAEFGLVSETVHMFAAADLDPINSTMQYASFLGGRFTLTAGGNFQSTLRLPEGSRITRFTVDTCDNSGVGQIVATVVKCSSPANTCGAIGSPIASGVAFTDGGACETLEHVLAVPEQIDNVNNIYFVQAYNEGNFSNSTRFNGFRVYYKRQVNPGPGVATFGDVPTSSPVFRFVEALAASGITGGCGNGNYCPNDPVTRGQMAVFLAAALGLHWAP